MMKTILEKRAKGDTNKVAQPPSSTGFPVSSPDAVEQSPVKATRGSVVEKSETANTTDLGFGDIVIVVIGPTGSGKSTLICAASGRDTGAVGHDLRSSTSQVCVVKFWDQESRRHIVLVDTPGCDDISRSSLSTLRLISEWLVSSYGNKKLLSGLLYLHRITDNRVDRLSLESLRLFRKLCGGNALDKVYLTTTMWDEVELSVGERRLEELRTEYWKSMIVQGAQVARCRSDDDSSKGLVRQIVTFIITNGVCTYRYDVSEQILSQSPSEMESYDRTLLPENSQESCSYFRAKPQTYEGPHDETPIPRHPIGSRQGSSSQSRPVENPIHVGGESVHIEPLYAVDPGHPSTFNIILFGEAGVGKSSVINLIADEDVAGTSPNAWGCTLESKQYRFKVARRIFNIWDTIGLGEPMFGVTNCASAIEKTYVLIRQVEAQGGLDLLLFCIPGSRITSTMLCNYKLFFEVLCEKRIPIAVVVTHLEDEEVMEEWWDRNKEYISKSGLKFGGHACITGQRGHPKAAESRSALELLLLGFDRRGRYPMPPASDWFSGFLERLPSIPRSKALRDKQKELERFLQDHCMMDSADAQRLAENLARREHDR